MIQKYSLNNIGDIKIPNKKPLIVFLKGDLWAWKTTLSKHILQDIFWITDEITSPTYTYYNKYDDNYHFDLYRIWDYDEFFAIWWEDILDNLEWVALIEWPEKIEKYYKPDIEIYLRKTDIEDQREIEIIKRTD
jgi:tRNA threonylcarbamoyl adenosine modification protein YjeE